MYNFDKENVISEYNASRSSMIASQDMKTIIEG